MKLLADKTLLIVGLGLIGGSIARGLMAAGAGMRILAHGRDELQLQTALLDGSIHAFSTDITTLAPQADIVMLCTPTLTVRPMLEQLSQLVGPETIITDAASVKGNVVAEARLFFGSSLYRIVPGHPVAGSEQSGYKASKADLFHKRKVILTPLLESSSIAVRTVMELWQVLGADVHSMSAGRHDQVLAGTSHLPHLLAFTLVNTLVDSVGEADRAQQVFDYAAGGFADFSRIASSDPVMWRDIFLANTDATVDVLDAYIGSLQQMRQRLLRADGPGLESEFRRAKRVRDEFIRRFRPGANQTDSRQLIDSGFTVEPELITVRKGSFIQGFFYPSADNDAAFAAIRQALDYCGVSVIQGVPENLETIDYLQELSRQGVPVIEPEKSTLWVYGASGASRSSNTEEVVQRKIALPADAFLVGLLVLAASIKNGSSLCIRCQNTGEDLDRLLVVLAEFGLVIERSIDANGVAELLCGHNVLSGAALDGDMSALATEHLAVVLVAAALAPQPSSINLAAESFEQVARLLGELADWLADFVYTDGVLHIHPRPMTASRINAGGNTRLALLAIVAGQASETELEIEHPGDIAASYPGLLGQLLSLGMNFTVFQA